MLHSFSCIEDALLVFKHSTDRHAQMAAFHHLEQFMPADLKAEMYRRAKDVLDLSKMTPGAFNAKGEPLYSAAQIAEQVGVSVEDVEKDIQFMNEEFGMILESQPVDHPTLKPLLGRVNPGQIIKTDQVDEDGLPIYIMNARAVMQVTADELKDGNSKAKQVFNVYCSLAIQRGCSREIISRFRQAAERVGGQGDFLKWLDRVAKFLPEEEILYIMFPNGCEEL
jgi:hypothetical protein